jgi:uncharacterized protein (DUF58 family)
VPGREGRFSGLTTRGRSLLAGGLATAACSLVLDERDLLRVGAFVALLPLFALVLSARTRRTLRVERILAPARVSVGSEVSVELHLRGAALLGSMRLADTVPDAAGPHPTAPPRFTVHRFTGRGSAVITYPLRPVLRGVHTVGPLLAGATDPLGLAEFDRSVTGPQQLVVLPRVVGLRGLPAALGSGDGTPGAARAHQGHGTSDVLTRPYRHGDELRRVHWRSTARYDELMVRLEERPWRGGITVLLDRRDGAHHGHGAASSLEFAISLTASICAHLMARGEPVSVVTEDGAALTGPTAAPGLDPVLDALAALRPSARTDLGGPELDRESDVLAVLGTVAPGQIEGLLARRPTGGHAILLDTPGWDAVPAPRGAGATAGTAAVLRRAGWQVTVAAAGCAPDVVWDALTSGAAPDGVQVVLS